MFRALFSFTSLICISALAGCSQNTSEDSQTTKRINGIRATASAEQIAADCETALARAYSEFAALEAQTGEATVASVFGQYEKVSDLSLIHI